MSEQEYEIYDIITKQKVEKSQVIPGKSYIISYAKDKWKIRKVIFNENGEIKSEDYIRLEDKQEAVIKTIINILKTKGNTDIDINYNKAINIEGIEIRLPIYNVKYKDEQGKTKERMLESHSLKDILTFDEKGNKHIIIKDAIIQDTTIQIGNSEKYDSKNNANYQETMKPKEYDNPITVNWSNVEMDSDTFISKGNVIFNVNNDGKTASYDLRTNEGVGGLKEYMESQKEGKNLS